MMGDVWVNGHPVTLISWTNSIDNLYRLDKQASSCQNAMVKLLDNTHQMFPYFVSLCCPRSSCCLTREDFSVAIQEKNGSAFARELSDD